MQNNYNTFLESGQVRFFMCSILIGWIGFSCESGTEPLPTTLITQVKVTPELATTNYTSVFNVSVEDTLDMPFLYRWSLQHSGNTTKDTVTESGRFYWIAPPESGNYTHSVRLVNEKEQELSEEFTFEVHVAAWEPPAIGSVLSGKIVFSAAVEYEDPHDLIYHIFSMNVDGSDLKQLTNFDPPYGSSYFPSWSSDGSKIVFASGYYGSAHTPAIWIMNADGSDKEVLDFHYPFGLLGDNPKWSPDGKQILYSSYNGEDSDIYIYNLDNEENVRITSRGKNEGYPVWSPDGFRLLFLNYKGIESDIYSINDDGNGLKKLTNNGRSGLPVWSSDGASIVFRNNENVPGLYRLNLNTSQMTSVITQEDFEVQVNLTPWRLRYTGLLLDAYEIQSKKHGLYILDIKANQLHKIHEEDRQFFGADWYIGDE